MVAPVIQVDDALHQGALRFEVEQEAVNQVLDESPDQQPGGNQAAEPGNRHAPGGPGGEAGCERQEDGRGNRELSNRKMAEGTAS